MKHSVYRNPKLLALARGQACVMCDAQDDTIVSAHSNLLEHGKGKGLKSHDGMVSWLCYRCHTKLDQGKDMTREQRRDYTLEAICRTYMRMWDFDLLKVK